jgi:hypothetical protein
MVMAISLTYVLEGSKPIIFKDANLVILKISELACDSHENSTSSKSQI